MEEYEGHCEGIMILKYSSGLLKKLSLSMTADIKTTPSETLMLESCRQARGYIAA